MTLVIGNNDLRMFEFLKTQKIDDNFLVINKMCTVKYLKQSVNILIPFGIILDSGLISGTMVHLEELLITLNVKKIINFCPKNDLILSKLANNYDFLLENI